MNLRRFDHILYVCCGAPVLGVYLFVGANTQTVLYDAVGFAAAATSALAARRLRGWRRRTWLMLAVGLAFFVAGDAVSSWYTFGNGSLPFPSVADALYLCGYACFLVGLLFAARRTFAGSLLDASTVAGVVAFLGYVLLIEPSGAGLNLGSLVAVAYPTADVLLLSLLALVALGDLGAGERWLAASFAAYVGTDVVYAQMQLHGSYDGGIVDLGWVAAYVLWGAAALRASSEHVSAKRIRSFELLPPVVAVGALPLAVAAQAAAFGRVEAYDTAVAGSILAGLAIARLAHLVHNERALRAQVEHSEKHFRSLIENSAEIFSIIDAEGRVQYQSPSLARVLGYEPHELFGRDSAELIHPDDLDAMREGLAALHAQPDELVTAELRTRHKHGHWVLLEATATNRLADPAVGGLVVCSRDVTRQRATEVEQARLQHELHQAQKMDAIGRLAGGVAHDFNNLLMVMSASTESALLEIAADSPLRRRLEQTQNAVQRAAALTQQLLTFSRRQQPSLRAVDLNAQIQTTCSMLRRLIGENVTIETDFAPGLPPVNADPVQLDQVLLNLALNARDAMPGGGSLRFETRAGAGEAIELHVSDTGVGMDGETRERLFEPFFTTKQPGRGTGLGLATVYGIVTRSGGSIRVDSDPGSGTRFVLTLPCSSLDVSQEEPSASAAAAGSGETILLVEDEETVRNVVREGLQQHGYRVVDTGDPRDAPALAAEEDVDLLVTDIRMPHMNGFELYDRLKNARPDLRAVFISGYSETAHAPTTDGTAFLEEPFAISDLTHTLRRLLEASVPAALVAD